MRRTHSLARGLSRHRRVTQSLFRFRCMKDLCARDRIGPGSAGRGRSGDSARSAATPAVAEAAAAGSKSESRALLVLPLVPPPLHTHTHTYARRSGDFCRPLRTPVATTFSQLPDHPRSTVSVSDRRINFSGGPKFVWTMAAADKTRPVRRRWGVVPGFEVHVR